MEQETKQPHEMEQMPKQKSGNGTVVALVIVMVLAIAALGGLWYYMNNKAENDKKASDAQIQQLQKQLDELKNSAATSAPAAGDAAAILAKSKEVFNYWTSNKAKDYQDLKDKGYITQALLLMQTLWPQQAATKICLTCLPHTKCKWLKMAAKL